MSDFNLAVDYVLSWEKGLEVDPNDEGGITNLGISMRFLRSLTTEKIRAYGFTSTPETINRADIEQLTPAQAKSIYKGEFWDHARFSAINSQKVCNFLFDMAVNMGISTAIKCAQRACWALMRQRSPLADDGVLGDKTIEAINRCGGMLYPSPLRAERAGEYRLIVERNPSQRKFLEGWLNRSYNEEI